MKYDEATVLPMQPLETEYFSVPEGIEILPPLCFLGCNLKAIYLAGATKISFDAFYGCSRRVVLFALRDTKAAKFAKRLRRFSCHIVDSAEEAEEEMRLMRESEPPEVERPIASYIKHSTLNSHVAILKFGPR